MTCILHRTVTNKTTKTKNPHRKFFSKNTRNVIYRKSTKRNKKGFLKRERWDDPAGCMGCSCGSIRNVEGFVMMTTTDAAGKPLNRPALAKGKEDAEWKGILYERKWWSQYTSKGTCYIGTLGGTSYWYTPTDWVKKKNRKPFCALNDIRKPSECQHHTHIQGTNY